jgi:hypothetical protein
LFTACLILVKWIFVIFEISSKLGIASALIVIVLVVCVIGLSVALVFVLRREGIVVKWLIRERVRIKVVFGLVAVVTVVVWVNWVFDEI